MLTYIIPFIVLILVVVFIHEYGHYYFAKKYGVGVTDFSIGFGKEIFGWNDKSGTRWKICWIPLGGYVKFFGDRNVYSQTDHKEILEKYSEEEQQKLFTLKPLYQRSLIVFGGPLANFLLAIVIFSCIYMFVGKDFTPAKIEQVSIGSPAEKAGLQKNDVIVAIDDNKVLSIREVSTFINTASSNTIDITVLRNDREISKENIINKKSFFGKTSRSSDYAQAIMEIGALICKPNNPLCFECPISFDCKSYKKNDFKIKSKNKFNKIKYFEADIYQNKNKYLLIKNNKFKFLKNFLIFPMKEVKKNKFNTSMKRKINIKLSNMDMKILLNQKNKFLKIKNSYLLDKKKIKNQILPSFTKKIFNSISNYS